MRSCRCRDQVQVATILDNPSAVQSCCISAFTVSEAAYGPGNLNVLNPTLENRALRLPTPQRIRR